jgi:AraC-like DNA-binding protein
VRPLLAYLSARGHESSAFLRAQGVDPLIFQDPEARLPQATAASLWSAGSRLTNDADLGLHVAEAIRPGVFGVLGLAIRTSDTLGGGLARLCRYHRFLHDGAQVRLAVAGQRAVLSHRLTIPGGLLRAVAEYVVATWLVTSRQATGVNWTPIQVRFPHAAPENSAEHRRVFGCPVLFGHECSEMEFARELLDLRLLEANPELQQILEAQVMAALHRLPKGAATTDAVRRHLAGELSKGAPTLEQVAPRLRMSTRTLHRRLEEERTSYREILNEVRRELATRHLQERQLAIGEIAFLLGFSEPSAFHRAFKRWTGHAPLDYRDMGQTSAARVPS